MTEQHRRDLEDVTLSASIFKPGSAGYTTERQAQYMCQVLALSEDAQRYVVQAWHTWEGSWSDLLEAAAIMTDDAR